MTKIKMSSKKLLLREFLQKCLDEESCTGVRWVDKEKLMFKIPWKHMAKQSWQNEDGTLFKKWQQNTGKCLGRATNELSALKTRFRCALNKAPDIKKVNSHPDKFFNIYQFSQKPHRRRNQTEPCSYVDEDGDDNDVNSSIPLSVKCLERRGVKKEFCHFQASDPLDINLIEEIIKEESDYCSLSASLTDNFHEFSEFDDLATCNDDDDDNDDDVNNLNSPSSLFAFNQFFNDDTITDNIPNTPDDDNIDGCHIGMNGGGVELRMYSTQQRVLLERKLSLGVPTIITKEDLNLENLDADYKCAFLINNFGEFSFTYFEDRLVLKRNSRFVFKYEESSGDWQSLKEEVELGVVVGGAKVVRGVIGQKIDKGESFENMSLRFVIANFAIKNYGC